MTQRNNTIILPNLFQGISLLQCFPLLHVNTSTGSLVHGSTITLFDEKFSTHEVVRIFKKLPLFRVFQEQTIDRRRNKTERQQKDNK
jgi:hypothetical protein